jgi:toxin-antitoxin system PIN domain toxin
MILIDANLLLYASLRELPQHPQARAWLEEVLNGDQLVGLPWMVVLAVLRISTNPRVLQQPLPAHQALGLIEGWLDHPLVQTIEPGPGHWAILRMLLAQAGTAANLTNDAHLAALAIGNDAVLCSADNDFKRFRGLRHRDPLR